jgi:type IV secretory pathway VirB3-like protein
MLAGGEFKLVVANLAFGFMAIALLHVWQYVLVVVGLHGVLIFAAKSDLQAREIYLEYTRQSDRYTPWSVPGHYRFNRRPVGFGRDQML